MKIKLKLGLQTLSLLTTFALLSIPASAISISSNVNPHEAANAIDSSLDSRWTTNSRQQRGQFIVIDMENARKLDQLTMITQVGSDSSLDYPRAYEVTLSSDGEVFGPIVASGNGSSSGRTVINLNSEHGR